jgi:hypothetical protein
VVGVKNVCLTEFCIARFQRPPGALPSSMLGYEAMTGSLDDFGFEDYLNSKDRYPFVHQSSCLLFHNFVQAFLQ